MSSNNTSANVTDASQGDTSGSTSAHGATSTSQGDQSSTTASTRSVEDLERLNAELIRDNANYRKKAKEQADTASAAEQARLAEQGQFKELAAKHEARVKQLEPVETSYKALSERVNAQIDEQIKQWPAEVKSLVPSSETPVEQRLEQLERLRPLVDKLQLQAQGTQRGNAPNPKPTGQVGDPATQDEVRKKLMRSGMYGI